jgi:predicted dehydrogenase
MVNHFRWGVLGTGFAARRFVHGLRTADDAKAVVVASRSSDNALKFAAELGIPRAAESYEAAVRTRGVDAFHIATPPSFHREHALLCLSAGKPVLVEKPFALNADHAREIVDTARKQSVFCMEGMWTRFLPLIKRVKELVDEGAVGTIRMLTGSFCFAESVRSGRNIFNADLGGGALLHRGVYPISLAFHLLGPPDEIVSRAIIGEAGIDEDTSVVFRYNSGTLAHFFSSLRTQAPNDLFVMGNRARIHVHGPIFRPYRMTLTPVKERSEPTKPPSRLEVLKESPWVHRVYQQFGHLASPILNRKTRHQTIRYRGNGYCYEADEVKRCVLGARIESTVMPLSESLGIMLAIDEIRSQWRAQARMREKQGRSTGESISPGGGA